MTSPVMIGRDAELIQLWSALESATRRRMPAALLVTGEAGVGKTRMISEFTGQPGRCAGALRCVPGSR